MTVLPPIAAIGAGAPVTPEYTTSLAAPAPAGTGFTDLVTSGLQSIDTKVAKADSLIEAYATGQSVPVHQVMLAIEQARASVEIAVQVRAKLVDTYHDFLNMQL